MVEGDKLMLKLHLRWPRFIYRACGSFTKNKNKTQKLKTGNRRYIYPAFSTMWLMDILNIYLEKQLSIKNYVEKHLITLRIQNMIPRKP